MDNEIEKYLFDVLESIDIIEKHLSYTTNYDAFSKNLLVQDAVQRRLAIIGEALWKVSKLTPLSSITDLQKIVSFLHILIHDYDKIETATIWVILTKKLSLLKKETENTLKQSDGFTIN